MLKYVNTALVLQEIPDEITLAISLSNCPFKCKNCHSKFLQENIGSELTEESLRVILKKYKAITCICFMGGDSDHCYLSQLADFVKSIGLKVAVYSGSDSYDINLAKHLDYYKIGHYNENLGPLNKKTTNQRLYKLPEKQDITYRFWKSLGV